MIYLKDFPIFRKWCDLVKNGFGRVDLLALDDKQKDKGLAAYCLDINNPEHVYLAGIVNCEYTPEEWKNDFYAQMENNLMDLCDQYNGEQDIKDAQAAYSYIDVDSYIGDEHTFNRSFNVNQDMYDAGHKPSDFC